MPGKRELIVAYRTARARAQRSTTARLRRDEAWGRMALRRHPGLDELTLARVTAVRDELQARGVGVPPLVASLAEARR